MHGSQIIFYNNKTNETKHQKKKKFWNVFPVGLAFRKKASMIKKFNS
jgi:hypothetical protein